MAMDWALRCNRLKSICHEAVVNAANKHQEAQMWFARSVLTGFAVDDDDVEDQE
jgi:hypothetical protein